MQPIRREIDGDADVFRRGPAAVLAAIAVMAAAGGFIAFSLSRAPVRVSEGPGATDPATLAYAPPPVPSAPVPQIVAVPVADTISEIVAAETENEGPARDGLSPRLAPRRSSAVASRLPEPRLKPGVNADTAAAPAIAAAPTVMRLSGLKLADPRYVMASPFTLADLEPRQAPPPPALVYAGDLSSEPREMTIEIERGETFVDALRRAGVRAEDRNAAAYAFADDFNMRRLRPGQEIALVAAEPNRTLFQEVTAPPEPDGFLMAMRFRVDAENRIDLTRTDTGEFASVKAATPLTTRLASMKGAIHGSLYQSAKAQGAPDDVIASLANMFAYDVDFQRDIFGGDKFEAVFEMKYDENGRAVGGGEILFGRLEWRNGAKSKGYYRFETADSGGADYFDEKGHSARRLLMKTPIDGARLSSGFGSRTHPILGYKKAHKGVDFAASRGTPIKAAGDGVIERSGPYGSFGNYVKIRHSSGYKTAYAHLNAIKKGMRAGARVRQGDIIGYVGSTGRSTGPHLHYEVHYKDQQVNPQNLKIATGVELGGRELAKFKATRDRINAMREGVNENAPLLADNQPANKSL
jgi:murein DD-endopeptidase MepM/ murein hydrolase activator NlpD